MSERKEEGGEQEKSSSSSSGDSGGGVGRVPATELLMMVSGKGKTNELLSSTGQDTNMFHRQQQGEQFLFPEVHFMPGPNQLDMSSNSDFQFCSMNPAAADSWLTDPTNSYWLHGFQFNNLSSINSSSHGKIWNGVDGCKAPIGSTSNSMQIESLLSSYHNNFNEELDYRQGGVDVSGATYKSRIKDPLLMLFPTTERNAPSQDHASSIKSDTCESTIYGDFSSGQVLRQPFYSAPSEGDNDVKYIGFTVILQKELSNSDVGSVGRIVLPKREAEANLPPLCDRDGLFLHMDDLVLQTTWTFKYRFWPNNKSRMYILESTGEFVRAHSLQSGDSFILYKDAASGDYIVRGKKASRSPSFSGTTGNNRCRQVYN